MRDLSFCKRVWMITDTHLGVRNSAEEWMEIHRDYFLNEFIPLVKREYRDGDVLFHLGDVFDSRYAITLKVIDLAIDIFEELSKIFVNGIFVLAGNHDIWKKSDNTINSLKMLKRIPNVHIIDIIPETINVAGFTFLMMPWQKDHAADLESIRTHSNGQDYLMCHMDVYGMKGSRFNTIDSGTDVRAFSSFKRVYSGHIHYRQQMENVTMLGTPYELTRSDMYNEKCVTVLDPSTGNEVHYKNTTSPRFLSMQLSTMLEKTPEYLSKHFNNNFVDIHVDNINLLKIPVNSIVDMLDGSYRDIKFIPPNQFAMDGTDDVKKDVKDFDIKDTIREWCESSMYDQPTKDKLLSSLLKLYNSTMEAYKK
jgi:DNA repair exonuclease SbcCD nuclease subunit